MEKKDILYRLSEIGTDEAKIISKFIKEDETYLTDPKKKDEIFDFLLTQYATLHTQKIMQYNKQIAEGIESLTRENSWPNLNKIGRHAFESVIIAIDKDISFKKSDSGEMVKDSIQMVLDFDSLPYADKKKMFLLFKENKK